MDDPDGYFGEPVAASYHDPSDRMFQPEAVDPAVSLLAELAGSGRALELAIGTGRIGLPLSQRGVPVHGIELSRAMVARLRGKPGGDAIGVTIGDMAATRVDGVFTVAYLVYNTINNLTSQDAQVACFRNVAEHLTPGGCFVIETAIPNLRHLPPGQDILGYRAGPGRIVSYSFNHATQQYRGHYAPSAARSSALTSPTACRATNAASVVTAIGMMRSAGSARICAGGHGHPLASPRRRSNRTTR